MALAIIRRHLTAEARVQSRVSCGGQSGTGTGFSPSTSVLHYTEKRKQTNPLSPKNGCSASVACAAGTFTKKNNKWRKSGRLRQNLCRFTCRVCIDCVYTAK
jgi:hypothetical protein